MSLLSNVSAVITRRLHQRDICMSFEPESTDAGGLGTTLLESSLLDELERPGREELEKWRSMDIA